MLICHHASMISLSMYLVFPCRYKLCSLNCCYCSAGASDQDDDLIEVTEEEHVTCTSDAKKRKIDECEAGASKKVRTEDDGQDDVIMVV